MNGAPWGPLGLGPMRFYSGSEDVSEVEGIRTSSDDDNVHEDL